MAKKKPDDEPYDPLGKAIQNWNNVRDDTRSLRGGPVNPDNPIAYTQWDKDPTADLTNDPRATKFIVTPHGKGWHIFAWV